MHRKLLCLLLFFVLSLSMTVAGAHHRFGLGASVCGVFYPQRIESHSGAFSFACAINPYNIKKWNPHFRFETALEFQASQQLMKSMAIVFSLEPLSREHGIFGNTKLAMLNLWAPTLDFGLNIEFGRGPTFLFGLSPLRFISAEHWLEFLVLHLGLSLGNPQEVEVEVLRVTVLRYTYYF